MMDNSISSGLDVEDVGTNDEEVSCGRIGVECRGKSGSRDDADVPVVASIRFDSIETMCS